MFAMNVLSVVNRSTVLTDDYFIPMVAALNEAVNGPWFKAWGTRGLVRFVPTGETPNSSDALLVGMDTSDQAGTLGYHDETVEGMPLGKFFIKDDLEHGLSWTVTASHEAFEMFGDPDVNTMKVFQHPDGTSWMTPQEVCDPVEDDQFGFRVQGQLLSDFVYPAYFMPGVGRPPFDHTGALEGTVPLMATGGYLSVLSLHEPQGWQQIYGEEAQRDRGRLHRHHHRRDLYARSHTDRQRSTAW